MREEVPEVVLSTSEEDMDAVAVKWSKYFKGSSTENNERVAAIECLGRKGIKS